MFFEKDLSIPGDFKEKVDLIVDEVEKTIGLPFNYVYYVPDRMYYDIWGYNPWEGIELNKRIAIYVCVDRTDVYTFGRLLCEFLAENYGENFMKDYIMAIERVSKKLNYGNMTQEDRQMLADKLKETFGDDVFTNFGAWYQTHAK